MVDNVLNNGYGEKERREEIRMKAATYQEQTGASMTFYAAVCEEFHSMQACYEGLSLEEAVEKYKEIREDPRLAFMEMPWVWRSTMNHWKNMMDMHSLW